MKFNKWTLGLAAVGAVSLASAVRADEAKPSPLQTALSNTTISGYVDVAAQYNAGDARYGTSTTPVTGSTGYNVNNNPNVAPGSGVLDGFSLNVVNIAIDKPQDESPWASGYHIELNAGQNEIDGLNYYSTASHLAVRQAYVALRTPVGNGIDWKFGVFDGITGYEGNTGYSNPNYTRSYGYMVNPASEVGLLGSYKVCNMVSVQAGIVNRAASSSGFGSGTSPELSSKSYIASFTLTAPDSWGFLKGSTLNAQTIQTFDSFGANNYSVNGTLATPVAGLKVGFAYDKIQQLGNLNLGGDANIYGVYATYQATSKLSYNVRGEYVDGQNLPFFYVGPNGGNNNGKGEEVTLTVEYDLWANVVSRLEARWDHTESGGGYNAQGNADAYLLALNIVYKF